MKITADMHTHTVFSYDAECGSSPYDTAMAAYEKGLSAIALTDHLDVNSEVEGIFAPFDFENRKRECLQAKEKCNGKINVICGIELGQATQYPALAKKYLKENEFEFVLGSLHNVKDVTDFALIDYRGFSEYDYISLWERYLSELYGVAVFDGIDCLAHLTYPLRYYYLSGFRLDLRKYEAQITKILNAVISNGLCLEVNSSGFRQGVGFPFPDNYVLELYYQLGGRKLTAGSDSHTSHDISADFDTLGEYIKGDFSEFIPN